MKKLCIIIILIFTSFHSLGFAQERKEGKPWYGVDTKEISQIINKFLNNHVIFDQITPELLERIKNQCVLLLKVSSDPDGVLFTLHDIEGIKVAIQADLDAHKKGGISIGFFKIFTADILIDETKALIKLTREYLQEHDAQYFSVDHPDDTQPLDFSQNKEELKERREKYIISIIEKWIKKGLPFTLASQELLEFLEAKLHKFESRKEDENFYNSLFLDAFASSLDPHSSFQSLQGAGAEALGRFGAQVEKGGLGVMLDYTMLYPRIIEIFEGGAAAISGNLNVGDRILEIKEENNSTWKSLKGLDALENPGITGKPGTKLFLKMQRFNPENSVFEIEIERKTVNTISRNIERADLHTEEINGEKIGIISIPSFYGGTLSDADVANDLENLLKKANQQEVKGLLIDISKNGGGLASATAKIIGFFFESANIGRNKIKGGKFTEIEKDNDGQIKFEKPIVILTSKNSASASEQFAGVLKAYGRALIVGDTTYGKGTGHGAFTLPDAFAIMQVTEQIYYLPDGTTPQFLGVTPHINHPMIYEETPTSESESMYAIPSDHIDSFLLDDAVTGANRSWKKISSETVKKVSAKYYDSFNSIEADNNMLTFGNPVSDSKRILSLLIKELN